MGARQWWTKLETALENQGGSLFHKERNAAYPCPEPCEVLEGLLPVTLHHKRALTWGSARYQE